MVKSRQERKSKEMKKGHTFILTNALGAWCQCVLLGISIQTPNNKLCRHPGFKAVRIYLAHDSEGQRSS